MAHEGLLHEVKRRHDWQMRFAAFMCERRHAPFVWGRNDCALFAADAVEAITGENLCPELRGHRDAREALRTLARFGGVRGVACRALGDPIPVRLANVGDVVTVPAGKREALAVCNGTAAMAVGPMGLVPVSMCDATAAWRVG